jgi:hypothetical protein
VTVASGIFLVVLASGVISAGAPTQRIRFESSTRPSAPIDVVHLMEPTEIYDHPYNELIPNGSDLSACAAGRPQSEM